MKKKCNNICIVLLGVLVKIFGILCIVALALGLTFGLLSLSKFYVSMHIIFFNSNKRIQLIEKKGYTEICKQTTDCDINAGLLCDNTSYICNCPDDYFYNFTTYTCRNYTFLQQIVALFNCSTVFPFKNSNTNMVIIA